MPCFLKYRAGRGIDTVIYGYSLFKYRSIRMLQMFRMAGRTDTDQFLMTFLPLMMYTPFFRLSVASDWRTFDLIISPATV